MSQTGLLGLSFGTVVFRHGSRPKNHHVWGPSLPFPAWSTVGTCYPACFSYQHMRICHSDKHSCHSVYLVPAHNLSLGAGATEQSTSLWSACIMLCKTRGEMLAKWFPLWNGHWDYMCSANKPTWTILFKSPNMDSRVLLCLPCRSYSLDENLELKSHFGCKDGKVDPKILQHKICSFKMLS